MTIQNIERERDLFDEWCESLGYDNRRCDYDPNLYRNYGVSDCWEGWQARAALDTSLQKDKSDEP
jgi:hypothetical protein